MKKLTLIKVRAIACLVLVLKKRLNLFQPPQNYLLIGFSFIVCIAFLISSCKRETEVSPRVIKISVYRKKELNSLDKTATINGLQKIDKISLAPPHKTGCYFIVPYLEGYLSGLPIEVLYEVNDIIVANFNEVANSRYETQQDALNAFQTAEYNAFKLASSKGLNFQPPGPQFEPVEQLCEGDVGFEPIINPCSQKLKIRDMMADATISKKNNEAKYGTLATGDEYGYEQKVTSFNAVKSFMDIPVRTDASTQKFIMNFHGMQLMVIQ